ncbi:uncharacterized protein LOC104901528 [Beta vulgaris subsp. vulgaris]|uniref:uncharacterized protein LOC104901528 n=1 Tax=Beta vulgaris subsp. vulgaris TaxID=3555 RepID=UPI00053FDE95|nr:uncharacterized protein LOC104901528 [Beta vulgaris subsp. vulgaris]
MAWVTSGDENTDMFHRAIKSRRIQNTYYEKLLGTTRESRRCINEEIIALGRVLSQQHQDSLMLPVTEVEIKNALFSIPGDKSPGPNGFGTFFYKDAWQIVGHDIIEAVKEFFSSGKLLREVNNAVITLIPKVKCPGNVTEFRPISCCNVIYKCITKVMCAKMKNILPDIITANQGAFIQGRFIAHNVLICQDMLRYYGRKMASSGCIIKMDMKKAYDSIDWRFLEDMIRALKFPERFISLIMECVTSPKCCRYFPGKKGLRQGDPMSPLLFLNHLCFTDDIKLCSKGDFMSVYIMLQGFKHFSEASCLEVNEKKTEVYTPGRLVLVNSVLLSINTYWAQIYILPKKVLHEIAMVCRAYLWSSNAFSSKGGYVAWSKVCLPKKAGGLGIRDIKMWNRAAVGRYVWAITAKKDNLWIEWVNGVYIKEEDWWGYKPPKGCCWYGKMICEIKEELKGLLSQNLLMQMEDYSLKEMVRLYTGDLERVSWDKYVWNKLTIPKHRFFVWLTMQNRLQTTSRLHKIGIANSANCLICDDEVETQTHLLFECKYSSDVFRQVKIWCGLPDNLTNVHEALRWIARSRKPYIQKKVLFAIMGAMIYHIWGSRNEAYWNHRVVAINRSVNMIQKEIVERMYSVMPKKIGIAGKTWLRRLANQVCN